MERVHGYFYNIENAEKEQDEEIPEGDSIDEGFEMDNPQPKKRQWNWGHGTTWDSKEDPAVNQKSTEWIWESTGNGWYDGHWTAIPVDSDDQHAAEVDSEDHNLPENADGTQALTAEEEEEYKRQEAIALKKATRETRQKFLKSAQAKRQAAPMRVAITEAENSAANRRDEREQDERPVKGHRFWGADDITAKADAAMDPDGEVTNSWTPGPSHGTEEQRISKDTTGMN